MKRLLIVLLLASGMAVYAQQLTVIDAVTRQTVAGVVIHAGDPAVSLITNARGQVRIEAFTGADSLWFQHISYATAVLGYDQLQSLSFIAELTASSISLDEVVVSANRWEQEKAEIPYRVEKISMSDAALQNPQTSADLLGSGGFVFIQKSQLAGGSPMIRGFATNRVLLVVDGVRMNSAIFRLGNLQHVISLDAGSFAGAEVLFGPGAVMYGSDAIGGVMDFHTLKPSFSDDTAAVVTGNAFVRYSSACNERTEHLDVNLGLGKWAFTTSLTYADYGDLRTGSKGDAYFLRPAYQATINGRDTMITNGDPQVQITSGFSQLYLMQKILFRPSPYWVLDYSFHWSRVSEAPRYDRLCLDDNGDSTLDYAEWYYGPQQWMMNRLGIAYERSNRFFDRMRLTTALQNYEESRHDRKFSKTSLRNQTEKVDALSLNVDLDRKISDRISLFYGAEAVVNLVHSDADRVNTRTGEVSGTATRYPDGSVWQAYGLYANARYRIGNAWTLNGGLRYSYYIVKADFDTTLFPFPFLQAENRNGALNGSIGLVIRPSVSWQVYANGSTGFHAPNIDDIGKVFESEPGSLVVPNAGLKPEYAWNIEAGTSKVFGRFFRADVTVYYTYLDNALARRDFQYNGSDSIAYEGVMSRVQAVQNISHAYVWGIQAGADIRFGKGIGLCSKLSFQRGKEQDEESHADYPLRHAAPLFGSTHLTWERKNLKLDFYTVYNGKMEYEDLALSERNDDAPYARDDEGRPYVPAWHTFNIKAAWYINKSLSLTAGIENVTDQLYRPYASGISASGRNFILALKGRF